jgi:membrane-associated protease RseP (regulator of RpoE activity)
VSIGATPIDAPDDVRPLVIHRAGDTLPVIVTRDGRERTFPVTIGHDPDDPELGLLGVQVGDLPSHLQPTTRVNPARGAWESVSTMGSWSWQTLEGLGSFATGGLGDYARQVVGQDKQDEANGPVVSSNGSKGHASEETAHGDNRLVSVFGVARAGADAAGSDMAQVLLLLAIVNLSIGIINLLPLLPFDGGHIAVAVYERVRSRRGRRHMADVSRLLPLTYAVVLVLGLIMVSSVYLDIVDPVGLR